MQPTDFIREFCNGKLEMPLRNAADLAGLNPRTILNDAITASRKNPLFPLRKRGGRFYVSSIDLFHYFFPQTVSSSPIPALHNSPELVMVRRGAPSLEERRAAAARCMTVAEMRRVAVGGGK